MKASIIVLNRNGETFLRRCLPSVQEATSEIGDIEVILVDNASTDQSITVTRSLHPGAKILSLDRNYGFAEANNKAAAIAAGDCLVFLNNDTVVDKDWLRELIRVADSDPSIAICGSRIMFIDSKDKINHAGGKITMIGSGYDQGFGMTGQSNNSLRYTGYACGASMLVRKSVFQRLRGFDTAYFALCEDVDLAWRAWIAGHKVIHVPTSIIYHKFSGTWHHLDKLYYWHRNCKINTIKNFETINVIRGLVLNLLVDILRITEGLRRRSVRTVRSVISGYLWNVRNIRYILKSRLLVLRQRTRSDVNLHRIGIFASFRESFLEYGRAHKDHDHR